MVASLWHQLLGTKVRLLVRLPANVMMRGLTVDLDSRTSRQLTNSLKTGLLRCQGVRRGSYGREGCRLEDGGGAYIGRFITLW